MEGLFEHLEINAKETFEDIKAKKESADRIAKEVRILGPALKEHEVCIDKPSKHVLPLTIALQDNVA